MVPLEHLSLDSASIAFCSCSSRTRLEPCSSLDQGLMLQEMILWQRLAKPILWACPNDLTFELWRQEREYFPSLENSVEEVS